jgi:hypothetical protein
LISFKVERNLQTKPDKVKALWLYDVFLRQSIKKIKKLLRYTKNWEILPQKLDIEYPKISATQYF